MEVRTRSGIFWPSENLCGESRQVCAAANETLPGINHRGGGGGGGETFLLQLKAKERAFKKNREGRDHLKKNEGKMRKAV